MKAVWKFLLETTDEQTVTMPQGTDILHVGSQDNNPALWGLVPDTSAGPENRTFIIEGTGHPIPHSTGRSQYLGTAITFGGSLVWHVFERNGA